MRFYNYREKHRLTRLHGRLVAHMPAEGQRGKTAETCAACSTGCTPSSHSTLRRRRSFAVCLNRNLQLYARRLIHFSISTTRETIAPAAIEVPRHVAKRATSALMRRRILHIYLRFIKEAHVSEAGHLPPFKLECYFSKWEFKARYNMAASDAQSMTLSELLSLGERQDREALDRLWLGYTETWESPT